MSFLSIFDAVSPVVTKILNFIPDPAQKAAAELQLMTALKDWDAQQNAVNAEEAKNSSVFVAGWRPFIGWVCGLAVAYQYLVVPLLGWALLATGTKLPPFPVLDNNLWQLLTGMLGLGGLRTIEKIKGVA